MKLSRSADRRDKLIVNMDQETACDTGSHAKTSPRRADAAAIDNAGRPAFSTSDTIVVREETRVGTGSFEQSRETSASCPRSPD
ncbi:MAG: hypothetical protein IT440_10785 [Phycisphaeraceae bacterium]|nr:hypothetical protein [Phycisphaeraceae bacterium]